MDFNSFTSVKHVRVSHIALHHVALTAANKPVFEACYRRRIKRCTISSARCVPNGAACLDLVVRASDARASSVSRSSSDNS